MLIISHGNVYYMKNIFPNGLYLHKNILICKENHWKRWKNIEIGWNTIIIQLYLVSQLFFSFFKKIGGNVTYSGITP